MTALKRFHANSPTDPAGRATFEFGAKKVQLTLTSFADAKAIDDLIEHAAMMANRDTKLALSKWLRGAADSIQAGA